MAKTGHVEQASLDVDSKLGLQVNSTDTRWLNATVQVLVGKRSKHQLKADV